MVRLKNNFLYVNLRYIQDLMTQLQFDINRKNKKFNYYESTYW